MQTSSDQCVCAGVPVGPPGDLSLTLPTGEPSTKPLTSHHQNKIPARFSMVMSFLFFILFKCKFKVFTVFNMHF